MRRLVLLKPEIVAHSTLLQLVVDRLRISGLPIQYARRIRMDAEAAAQFYKAHAGKFFYPRLVRHMTSGESVAFFLSDDVGQARATVGGGKLWPPRLRLPEGTNTDQELLIRHMFALSDVRNVAHVSDDECADQELAIIERLEGAEFPL